MEIHWLDIAVYFISASLLWLILPKNYKFETGILVGWSIMIIYTFIYIILFGLCDFNIINIFNSIDSNIKVVM